VRREAVSLATDRFRRARRRLSLAVRLRPEPDPDRPGTASAPGSGPLDPRVGPRIVRVQGAGTEVEVPARDGGEQLGHAFLLAELPWRRPLGPLRITALDADGNTIRTWRRDGCG
jgi:hypothetical protein